MNRPRPDGFRQTPEEDMQINAAIAADPDDFELDDAWFANARPAAEFFDLEAMRALKSLRHVSAIAIPDSESENSRKAFASSSAHPRG